MAILEDLRSDIKLAILDDDFSDDFIDALINRAVLYFAGAELLAGLESSGEAITVLNSSEVPIPVGWDFMRNLFDVQVENKSNITVLTSLEALLRVYPKYKTEAKVGPIEYAVISKKNIVYYPIPEEPTTLQCGFYAKPTLIAAETDEPECLPLGLHEKLIENYVLKFLYSIKEDGIEGRKVNTVYYKGLLNEALEELSDFSETGQSRPLPNRMSGWE
jgi:hypothetical protein